MSEPDPIALFGEWWEEARAAEEPGADFLVLATATGDGRPSARALVLRRVDEMGFVFYTDVGSRKARELAANPFAALVVVWRQRQVRAEGEVVRVPDEEADADFAERPRDHRLATWACRQTEPLESREELERRMEEVRRRFADTDVPRPPYWGGYRLVPTLLEFWEARANRLHDRVQYRQEGWDWVRRRLAP